MSRRLHMPNSKARRGSQCLGRSTIARDQARWLGVALVVGLLLGVTLPPTGLAAVTLSGAAPTGPRTWRIVPTPNADGSAGLVDVASGEAGEWAVGFSLPGDTLATLAMRRADSRWTVVPTPNPDLGFNRLDGVAEAGPHDVWAVGSRTSGTLIERWDGTGWSLVPSPNRRDSINNLVAISAFSSDDAWAVGSAQAFDGSSVHGLIQHWDGTVWKLERSPHPEAFVSLLDVAATSASDAWAVGTSAGLDGTGHNVALHWDGKRWSTVSTPSPGLSDNVLEAVVTLAHDDAWAVGYSTDSGVTSRTPLALHWDGSRWSIVPSPFLYAQLNEVAVASNGHMWAVGYTEDSLATHIEIWDGAHWVTEPSQNRHNADSNALFGVAVGANGRGWAVGSSAYGDGTLRTLVERSS
jgi:hypothetical protein